MTLEEIRKHKENQPQRECYSNNCPLHDDYGVKDKNMFTGPFAQCDASLCDKYVKSGGAK